MRNSLFNNCVSKCVVLTVICVKSNENNSKTTQQKNAGAERVILTKDTDLGLGEKMLVLNHVPLCLMTNL